MENLVKTENSRKRISPSTEMEMRKILLDNFVCGFGCLFVCAILCSITFWFFRINLTFFLIFGLCCIISLGVIINANLAFPFEVGNGDAVCRWCRNKAVANFLMLHYHNRYRTEKVLRLIENELDSVV